MVYNINMNYEVNKNTIDNNMGFDSVSAVAKKETWQNHLKKLFR